MIVREPADVLTAGSEPGEPLELHPDLLRRVKENRAAMLAALDAADGPIYGVNTGMGRLAGIKLTAAQQAEHQHNLLVGRAVGGPPWLAPELTRALLLMRLRGFLRSEAAVSPELVTFLADRLNDGFLPAVPRGGLGSAGEIIPLAHTFQTFTGLGSVLEDGVLTPAATALAQRGVDPFTLGPKEGASLIQGSPLAEAYAWVCGRRARRLLDLQTQCAAMAVDVLGSPHSVYRYGAPAEFRELIAGAEPRADVVQAPVSVRVGPLVLDLLDRVAGDLEAELGISWDTPADSPSFVDGEFVATTGYHASGLGFRMDALKAVLVHAGEISVQRLHRLLDPQFSGLPPQLAVDPGPQAGLVPLHKRAVGELHALRRLAAPATLGSLDTSAGQEDVQAFAWAAGAELEDSLGHLTAITACELVTAAQARYLRGHGAPALEPLYAWVAERVPPVVVDRPLGPEITRLIDDLR
ncbi:aromatic amino acid lyase [Amycolatopsis carbonis]|uniref:Aromatic amino acid lyase n=1 Tax=Amycolatopsis carbonis TaxID=715471 RepID=A0A9Y2MT25_9PSEU|nr:aromatic amino acid lyase [Amycolatopsis sp. 2-15]WIX80200.1 aromatic amino acid lyase [Amycolatopsis sp. 2-15]